MRICVESSFGGESKILSEVWLPKSWNGIFLGVGNGGIAGRFWYNSIISKIKEGYAVAQTDMGTSELYKNKKHHKDIFVDYSHRSTHIMTVAAKILIAAHYGRKPEFSYFTGSSAGGIQAFSEMQLFPEDYNGILAGVPSHNTLFLVTSWLWEQKMLRTREGKAIFSSQDAVKIADCATKFFKLQGYGEAEHNFVSNPYIDENTCENFIKFLKENCPEFSSEQISSLKKAYEGPVNPKTGEQIFCGLPIGSEDKCAYFVDGDFEFPWFNCFFGNDYNPLNFDFSDNLDKMIKSIGNVFSTNRPDLSAFKNAGGKAIYYSGTADPYGPSADSMRYYNKVCEKMGGNEVVSKFLKCFILPGKAHSNSGRGVNIQYDSDGKSELLITLRKWVENGTEPEYIIGAHKYADKDEFKFRKNIYPYNGDKIEGVDFPKSTCERYLEMTY